MENQASKYMSDDEYLNSLPTGYRFCPTVEELVTCYLTNKIMNKPLEPNRIREVNLYSLSPEQLNVMYKDPRSEVMYFFTKREKKYPNGSRPNRVTENGFWRASGASKPIGPKHSPIGYSRSLVYHERKHDQKAKKTDWLMKEYELNHTGVSSRTQDDDMKLDDLVLCKVYKKKKSKKERKEVNDAPSSSAAMVNETSDPETEYASGQIVSNQSAPRLPIMALSNAMLGPNGETDVSMPRSSPDAGDCSSAPSLPGHNGQIISHAPNAMFYAKSQQMPCFCEQNSSSLRMMAHPVADYHGSSSSQQLSWYGQNVAQMPESNPEFLFPNAFPVPDKNCNNYPQASQVFEDPFYSLEEETHMVRGNTQISFPMSAVSHVADAVSLTSPQFFPGNYSGEHSFPMRPPIQAQMIPNTGIHTPDQVLQAQYYNHHSEPNQGLVNPILPAADEMSTAHRFPNMPQHVSSRSLTHQPGQGSFDGYSDLSRWRNGYIPSSSSNILTHETNQQTEDENNFELQNSHYLY